MGWYRQNGQTAEGIRKQLLTDLGRYVKASAVGEQTGTLYVVIEGQENPGERLLLVYLIDGGSYKPMDESMGPYVYDCPLHLLDLVPCPAEGFAAKWRRGVRKYWEHAEVCQEGCLARHREAYA